MKKQVLLATAGLFLLLTQFQNCSDVKFVDSIDKAVNKEGCTNYQTTTEKIKFLFMVDNSGSTAQTDPSQALRTASIQDFINSYGTNNNLTYLFDMFASEASYFDGNTFQGYSASAQQNFQPTAFLQSALDVFKTIAPGGNTSYVNSFAEIQSTITADLKQNPDSKYVVIFMSDGQPTDFKDTTQILPSSVALVTNLITTATALTANQKSPVTVSTVYFCSTSTSTTSTNRCSADTLGLLKSMAYAGGGNFVNATNAEDIVIDNLAVVPGVVCADPTATASIQ